MQIPNIFTSFSPKIFLTIFHVKSKLSTAKKSKTAAFSRVFTQNNSTIFLRESKLNFWKISNSVHSSVHIEYFRITVLNEAAFLCNVYEALFRPLYVYLCLYCYAILYHFQYITNYSGISIIFVLSKYWPNPIKAFVGF